MYNLDVVYHSSDKFSWIMGVSMTSILINNPDTFFNFYIIENEISESNKEKLRLLEKLYHCNVNFVSMPDFKKDFKLNLYQIKENWLFDSFSRMFLGTLLPNTVEKVLYLDSDTIINKKIDYLIQLDLGTKLIAGVKESLSVKYLDVFQIDHDTPYFQGGVFLINLKEWRKRNIEEQIVSYINEKKGYIFFMEQTVMSAICGKDSLVLPLNYNWTTINSCFSFNEIIKIRKPNMWYNKDENEQAKKNVVIFHFTNCFYINNRPWVKYCNHPQIKLFLKYKEMSLFREKPLYEGKRNYFRTLVLHMIPKKILACLLGWIYNNFRVKKIIKEQKLKRNRD